jgi:hypothetical protein
MHALLAAGTKTLSAVWIPSARNPRQRLVVAARGVNLEEPLRSGEDLLAGHACYGRWVIVWLCGEFVRDAAFLLQLAVRVCKRDFERAIERIELVDVADVIVELQAALVRCARAKTGVHWVEAIILSWCRHENLVGWLLM